MALTRDSFLLGGDAAVTRIYLSSFDLSRSPSTSLMLGRVALFRSCHAINTTANTTATAVATFLAPVDADPEKITSPIGRAPTRSIRTIPSNCRVQLFGERRRFAASAALDGSGLSPGPLSCMVTTPPRLQDLDVLLLLSKPHTKWRTAV